MSITIKKTVKITNLGDWFKYASPKGEEKQWKKGRSALEMASFALSDDFEAQIRNVLSDCGINGNVNLTCEPEAETRFPSKVYGTGGPRNHDLLITSENIVVGVEAKVSEPFDKKISERKKNASNNLLKRIEGFADLLYGERRPDNFDDLRYQLFSATVGTIIEANNRNVDNAIMLVIVFEGNGVDKEKDYKKNVEQNDDDYKKFCQSLGLSENGGVINVSGTKCWIKKIKVVL